MLTVMTLNINGIRAGARKGFFDWLTTRDIDIICLQEIRAEHTQLIDSVFAPSGYHRLLVSAEKKGYSGVAMYSRQRPINTITRLGFELADNEGRFCAMQFHQLTVASVYFPSGTRGTERQQLKYHFLDNIQQRMLQWQTKPMILCGDVNIVHQQRDIKNWKSNQKNSGCLPEERAWLDTIFNQLNWADAFRQVNQDDDQYTWWSNRGRARENNVGWRIDYQLITQDLAPAVKTAEIYKQQFFSDHAPLIISYDM